MEATTTKPVREPSTVRNNLFNKILVAVDGSEGSQRASKAALELAVKLKAELIVFHAIGPISSDYRSALASTAGAMVPPISQEEIDAYYAYARRAALGMVGGTVSEAKERGLKVKIDMPDAVASVVEAIINHADHEHVDLIVVGTRGLGGFKKMLLGSVSSGVISHASCPVLVVR